MSPLDVRVSTLRQALPAAVTEDLPLPGRGATAERFEALFDLARRDLELARLAEAHHDARAIAAELGAVLPEGALYGVWAAAGPDPLVAEHRTHGYRLRGVATWCTGVGIVDRALVTARLGATSVLVDVPVAEGRRARHAATWVSPAFAATNTSSLRFDLNIDANAVLGEAGDYLRRPGFWHGAMGVAACWAGGAHGLYEEHHRRWKREDPHSLAHLGSAYAWSDAMQAVLGRAAAAIDADPHDYAGAEARARSVRHVIERLCTALVDDLGVGAGPEPLAFDETIVARAQQLQLYIRQCHGERDLAPLGRHLIDQR